ncbi:MAG: SDR family oxidoreductase [Alphaproteobacteria bacterium]|nr:SDR family oxidoreductase [Alphaproteobacteria bacterium]
MGRAIAAEFARNGHDLALAARNTEQAGRDAEDLRLRHGITASVHRLNVLEQAEAVRLAETIEPLPDVAICVVGLLGSQAASAADPAAAELVLRSNFNGPTAVLAVLANRFERRDGGVIVGISSVAGERGRASNYVYGSAKAGFTAFLSGLRNRFAGTGVHVVTVKPGFVATRMTEGMNLPARLTARPDEVGRAVYDACAKRKDEIYVRPVWRLIMAVIRAIPEWKFKRLKL